MKHMIGLSPELRLAASIGVGELFKSPQPYMGIRFSSQNEPIRKPCIRAIVAAVPMTALIRCLETAYSSSNLFIKRKLTNYELAKR